MKAILAYVFVVLIGVVTCDECDEAINIGDARRSVNYQITRLDDKLCDDSTVIDESKWYRFDAYTGSKMTEKDPSLSSTCTVDAGHCGSTGVVYMNGKHPTDGNIADVKICGNYGRGCCDWEETIKVKRCVTATTNTVFFVYKLKIVFGCDMAYCVGTGLVCPNGEVYSQTQGKCIADTPPNMSKPLLNKPDVPADPNTELFKFKCTIVTTETDQSAKFTVQWISKNHILSESDYRVTNKIAELSETAVKDYLGNDLRCQVTAKFDNGESKKTLISDPYWMGIKVPQKVFISESDPNPSIQLESTLPITCLRDTLKSIDCGRVAYLSLPGKLATRGNDACKIEFSNKEPNPNIELRVIGNPGTSTPKTIYLTLAFDDGGPFTPNGIWTNYQLPNIQVQLTDTVRDSSCLSTGDPHYTTFDGLYYHLYQPGQFVLTKSTLNALEIQTRLKLCNGGGASCNCAVAVREGNTVHVIDNCNELITYVEYQGSNPTGAMHYEGNIYKIHTPSGVLVEVTDYGWYMNIEVKLPSAYKDTTEGLCGKNNGLPADDLTIKGSNPPIIDSGSFPRNFTESYRIPTGDSYFFEERGLQKLCGSNTDVNHCKCKDKEIKCDFNDGPYEYFVPCDLGFVTGRRKRSVGPQRLHKRSTQSDSKYDDRVADLSTIFSYTFNNTAPNNPTYEAKWPTKSGISENEAEEKCHNVLKGTPVYEECKVHVNTSALILGCKEDIKYADSFVFADGIAETFNSKCKFIVSTNVVEGSTNQTIQEQLLTSVVSKVCPSQCSGNGMCKNGTCQCNQGFISVDCSIKKGVAPNMTGIETSLCDLQKRPCQSIRVRATPLTDLLNLKCKTRHVKLSSNGRVQTSTTSILLPGKLLSKSKILCSLPVSPVSPSYNGGDFNTEHGMYISVSNDGINFSEEKFVVLYDSMCRNCTDKGICQMKKDSCHIDGQCYTGNDCTACSNYNDIGDPKRSSSYTPRPGDTLICDSSLQQDQWYRFKQYTGGIIPSTCITSNKCGTNATVWMKPIDEKSQKSMFETEVCSNLGNDKNDCCSWKENITLRKCQESTGTFYVYKLPPLPNCSMGYCSGNIKPCEEGETWNDSHSRCLSSCKEGSYHSKSTNSCLSCIKGTYKGLYDLNCVACPKGFTTDSASSTTSRDCFIPLCQTGEYLKGSICTKCPDGYYQDQAGMSSCKPCGGDLDKVTTNGIGATSNRQCVDTDECNSGKHTCISSNLGGICIDLPKWGYSCVCKAGWIGNHPNCQMDCPPGREYNKRSNTCTMCSKGTYKSDGLQICQACPAGLTTQTTGSTKNTDCNAALCSIGHYADGLSCIPCPEGYYQDKTGTNECAPCGEDLTIVTTNGPGATSQMQCEETDECKLNTHNCLTSSFCVDQPKKGFTCKDKCPSGTVNSTSGTRICEKCSKGSYRSDTDNYCVPCGAGLTTPSTGSTKQADCNTANCPAGKYADGNVCQPCPEGYFQDQSGKTNCKACGSNLDILSTNGTGASSQAKCYDTNECNLNKHNCNSNLGQVCVDRPKWGYTCQCGNGWTGSPPDCKPLWNQWSFWSTCSPECGPGYHLRKRTCSSSTIACDGVDTEYNYCILQRCTGPVPTPSTVISVSDKDLKHVLEKKNMVEDTFKRSVSNYCTADKNTCCKSLGYTKARASEINSWVDSSEVEIYESTSSEIRFSVKMQLSKLAADRLCETNRKKRSSASVLTLPGYIVQAALKANISSIEQAVGIVILSVQDISLQQSTSAVNEPSTTTNNALNSSSAQSKATEGSSNSSVWIIVGCCVALVVVLAAGIAVVLCIYKKSKRNKKQKPYERTIFTPRANTPRCPTPLFDAPGMPPLHVDYNMFVTTKGKRIQGNEFCVEDIANT